MAINPAEKAAYMRILQELQIIALEERIQTLGKMGGVGAYKETYE